MTASTCSSSDPKRYAYVTTGQCSTQEPEENGNFDADKKAKNIYQCDADHPYFDASGSKAKCVSEAECVGYLFGEGDEKQCLSRAQCAKKTGYLVYENDDNSTRECVTEAECHDAGYALRIQCLTKTQCEARGYYHIE